MSCGDACLLRRLATMTTLDRSRAEANTSSSRPACNPQIFRNGRKSRWEKEERGPGDGAAGQGLASARRDISMSTASRVLCGQANPTPMKPLEGRPYSECTKWYP